MFVVGARRLVPADLVEGQQQEGAFEVAIGALPRFGQWPASITRVGGWSQSTIRHILMRVAEAAGLTGVADDRQGHTQTHTRHR